MQCLNAYDNIYLNILIGNVGRIHSLRSVTRRVTHGIPGINLFLTVSKYERLGKYEMLGIERSGDGTDLTNHRLGALSAQRLHCFFTPDHFESIYFIMYLCTLFISLSLVRLCFTVNNAEFFVRKSWLLLSPR